MSDLKEQNINLKDHLLTGIILRHSTFSIKRDRDIFVPVKFDSDLNAVNSLFQINSGNPLNTKEAELFPGFIQVQNKSISKVIELTTAVNKARWEIKKFLKPRAKKTCLTTDRGVVYTQNPLMYRHHRMVNTMQMYRHLTAVDTNTIKSSFIWQSNKRYLKYDKTKALNVIHSAILSPTPMNVDRKVWESDLNAAVLKIERLPVDSIYTKICSTEPKPHFKFKPVNEKVWTSHYGATPLIISNFDDNLFSVDKKMLSIDVTNKHKYIPVGEKWVPLCKSLNLYYQQ